MNAATVSLHQPPNWSTSFTPMTHNINTHCLILCRQQKTVIHWHVQTISRGLFTSVTGIPFIRKFSFYFSVKCTLWSTFTVIVSDWHMEEECTKHVNCRGSVSFVPLCFLIHSPPLFLFLSSLFLSYCFLFPLIEKEKNKSSSILFIIYSNRGVFTIFPWESVTQSIQELLLPRNTGNMFWLRFWACDLEVEQVWLDIGHKGLDLWRTNKTFSS